MTVDDVACANVDPEVWFPDTAREAALAKQICRGCDAQTACLQYALDNHENFGVWGGTTPRDRNKLLKIIPGA